MSSSPVRKPHHSSSDLRLEGADNRNSSIERNHDRISNDDDQQIYINTHSQYDPNGSYHGYNLSRDVSEYRFGDDPNVSRNSRVNTCNEELINDICRHDQFLESTNSNTK
jgi:hypothetical protein